MYRKTIKRLSKLISRILSQNFTIEVSRRNKTNLKNREANNYIKCHNRSVLPSENNSILTKLKPGKWIFYFNKIETGRVVFYFNKISNRPSPADSGHFLNKF